MKLQTNFSARRTLLAVGLGFAAALSAVPDALHAQTIHTLVQDFAPDNRNVEEAVVIENNRAEPVLLTVAMMTRRVDGNGNEINGPTNDFEVSPTQALLGPNQSQIIKLQWRGPGNPDRELMYRLVAEQHPLASAPVRRQEIKLAFRYVGAIYVLPANATADVAVDNVRAVTDPKTGRVLELSLKNRGLAHSLIDDPVLTVSAGGVTKSLDEAALGTIGGENILAGSMRTFRIAWPEGLPFEQPKASLKFTPVR